jgi:poly-beta-1,6-N-acetyl-D-glucosamine N-deacetylase
MRCLKYKFQVSGLKFSICILYFAAIFCNPQLAHAGQVQDNRPFLTSKDQFNYAIFLYKQGYYLAAAREFGRVIEYFPGSPVIPQAQYMIGDAYLNASMYKDAVNQFHQFIENFSDNELKDEALLKLDIAKTRLNEAAIFSMPKLPIIKIPSASLPSKGANERAIQAVQVALFEGKDYKEVESEIDGLKAAGIDTIILRVFHNKDDRFYPFIVNPTKRGVHPQDRSGVYFKTKESPLIEDILGAVLDMAHKKGLKVFAWMTTRYADYGMERRKDTACKSYDFHTKEIVSCKGLDLFNEDAVHHLEMVFQDLANYPIDGVLFQDDLVLKHNEGFGPYAERLFERDNGRPLTADKLYNNVSEYGGGGYSVGYTDEFWIWAAWKNKRLLHVAERIRAAVKNKRPDVKFAINLMYESISNPHYAMAWLSQSFDEAIKVDFDYYAIMAYQQQMQDELKKGPYEISRLIEQMANDAVSKVSGPQKVLMKLQTINWNNSQSLPEQDVIGILRKLKEIDNISIAVVPYRRDFPFMKLAAHKKIIH